jgi:hypothetical protein
MRLSAFTLLIIASMSRLGSGVLRRCFSCRSRGELGDCRDPFYLSGNSTIIESKQAGVETPPCASGWCRKIEDGDRRLYKDAEYGAATQRDCMQRPPSDGKERCADVMWNRKMVYMCFCKGDLCNTASKLGSSSLSALLVTVLGSRIVALLR